MLLLLREWFPSTGYLWIGSIGLLLNAFLSLSWRDLRTARRLPLIQWCFCFRKTCLFNAESPRAWHCWKERHKVPIQRTSSVLFGCNKIQTIVAREDFATKDQLNRHKNWTEFQDGHSPHIEQTPASNEFSRTRYRCSNVNYFHVQKSNSPRKYTRKWRTRQPYKKISGNSQS